MTRDEDEVLDTIVRRSRTLRRRRVALGTAPFVLAMAVLAATVVLHRATPQTLDSVSADQPSLVEEADRAAVPNDARKSGPQAESTPGSLPIGVAGVTPSRPPSTDTPSPALTPDPVVFVTTRSGPREIWTMEVDGADPTLVVTHDKAWGPVLSPDRTQVAYTAPVPGDPDPQATAGLWVVGRSGGQPRLLWQTPDHSLVVTDWSADGTTLLFTNSEVAVGGGSGDLRWGSNGTSIHRVRQDGTGHQLVIDDARGGRFTADGSQIVYDAGAGGIWSAAADGTDAKRLTTVGNNPAVSPDGRIAFTGNESILIVDADGSREQRVAWSKGALFEPSWSTDGQALVATGYHYERQAYVTVMMRTDGTDPRVISASAGDWGARFPSFGQK